MSLSRSLPLHMCIYIYIYIYIMYNLYTHIRAHAHNTAHNIAHMYGLQTQPGILTCYDDIPASECQTRDMFLPLFDSSFQPQATYLGMAISFWSIINRTNLYSIIRFEQSVPLVTFEDWDNPNVAFLEWGYPKSSKKYKTTKSDWNHHGDFHGFRWSSHIPSFIEWKTPWLSHISG